MEICGEYLGFHDDKAIFGYFRKHCGNWFPDLNDRTALV